MNSRECVTMFCFLVSCILPVVAEECSVAGSLKGQVVDSADRPIANVRVASLPLECAFGGLMPSPAKTDIHGRFILTAVPSGLAAVYTSKPEDGYPDNSLAFYGVDFPPQTVAVRARSVTGDIVIRLNKAEIVAGKILEDETSEPLLNAWIRISRAEHEDLRFSVGPNFAGDFHFLLPLAKVKIEVTARGYEPWLFVGSSYDVGTSVIELGDPISLKAFGTRQLNVRLRKLHEQAAQLRESDK
jgi:hypothetical protein